MDFFIKNKGYKRPLQKYIVCTGVVSACVVMVAFPEFSIISAQKGLALWATSVLPALLPFFLCVNFLSSMRITDVLPIPIFTFVMSILSGYPMGAKITGDLCRNGVIDSRQALWMMSYCSTSGPAFIAGSVGVTMLGSSSMGTIMSVVHVISAAVNGIIFYYILGMHSWNRSHNHIKYSTDNKGIIEALTESIISSFRSLAIILAYIVIFMFITDAIEHSGFAGTSGGVYNGALLRGMFEITVGCSCVAGSSVSLWQAGVMCSFLIAFGGLSVIGQSMSMLAGTCVSIVHFIFMKLCQGILAALLMMIVMLICT